MANKKDFAGGAAAGFFGNDADGNQTSANNQQTSAPPQWAQEQAQQQMQTASNMTAVLNTGTRNAEVKRAKTEWGKEPRSKRVNLLMRPTLYELAQVVASLQGISLNHLAEIAIEKYAKEEYQKMNDGNNQQ